jgi:hypothetical protein
VANLLATEASPPDVARKVIGKLEREAG